MAGPPVKVQVRVNTGGSVAGSVSNWKVMSPGIVTCPVGGKSGIINTLTPGATDITDDDSSSKVESVSRLSLSLASWSYWFIGLQLL